jgi:hypothetical protein
MAKRAFIIDEPGQCGEIVRRNETTDRRLAPLGVGEKGVPVPVSQPRGFDVPVKARRAHRSVGSGTKRFKDAEHHERDHTRPIGGALPDVQSIPARLDGLDKFGGAASVGEVLLRLQSAGRPQRRDHVGRDWPGIKGVRSVRGDFTQRAGEPGLDKQRAFLERAATGEKSLFPARRSLSSSFAQSHATRECTGKPSSA